VRRCCHWQFTGLPTRVTSDNAGNFTAELTREFLKRVGCSPIWCTPRHPEANSVERTIGTIRAMISKVAEQHPRTMIQSHRGRLSRDSLTHPAALPVAAPLRRRCVCPIRRRPPAAECCGVSKSVTDWMSANRFQLNSDKTEFMWLTTARSQHQLPTSGPLIGSTLVSPPATVHDLGVFIDQDLTMKTHVQRTASRCFATLRQLRSIRRYMPTPVFQFLVSALVLSRLDYCNILLINLPLIHIQRLQSVHNAAARLIFNLIRCDHITDISLRWLRVPERITFKVAMLMYRALHGSAPPYLKQRDDKYDLNQSKTVP